jgi:phage recombination protein Bet
MSTALAPTGAVASIQRPGLSALFGSKYGIDQAKVFELLRATALKSKEAVSNEEVAAFMVVCNQYDLNTFIKEIYGFVSKGKMQYVISVDGWATLINRQASLNGIEFQENFDETSVLRSITCKIHRKDRALPTVVTEYRSECSRDTDVWKTWPVRMLRHKAMIQCARIAFGLAGVMDEDEAERMAGWQAPTPIIEGQRATPDAETAQYFDALGWNEAKRGLCMRSFTNRERRLEYLRAEAAKANIVVQQPKAEAEDVAQRQPDYEDESQEAEPTVERSPEPPTQAPLNIADYSTF